MRLMTDLRAHMKSHKITQAAFAEVLGVSQPAVGKWLAGVSSPNIETAVKIENATAGAIRVEDWPAFECLKKRMYLRSARSKEHAGA